MVVIGVTTGEALNPQWVMVMAWTTKELFKVRLRDDILTAGPVQADIVLGHLKKDINDLYVRKPMADFEYLEASITPTGTQWGVSFGVSLVVRILLTILCIRVDVFNEDVGVDGALSGNGLQQAVKGSDHVDGNEDSPGCRGRHVRALHGGRARHV